MTRRERDKLHRDIAEMNSRYKALPFGDPKRAVLNRQIQAAGRKLRGQA